MVVVGTCATMAEVIVRYVWDLLFAAQGCKYVGEERAVFGFLGAPGPVPVAMNMYCSMHHT